MKNESDVYRRLQKHLDELPVGYPATESGVELRILRQLFTPEEAEVALSLSAVPETARKIRQRQPGRTEEELERMLDHLVEKGAIFGGRMLARGGAKRYSRAPLVIGMYEAQVDRLTKELQQDFEQYAREGFAGALLGAKTKQMRTVPVNARFVPDRLSAVTTTRGRWSRRERAPGRPGTASAARARTSSASPAGRHPRGASA